MNNLKSAFIVNMSSDSQTGKSRERLRVQHRNHKIMALQDEKRKATRMYLSVENRRLVSQECGNQGALLHSYYVDLAEETSAELTDEYLAIITGWSKQVVQRWRLKLEKACWFKKITLEDTSKKFRATYYLLDKTTVHKSMDNTEYEESLKVKLEII